MARTFVAASSQYLENSSPGATARPVTMVAWVKPVAQTSAAQRGVVELVKNANAVGLYGRLETDGTVSCNDFDGTTVATAQTTAKVTGGAWNHVAFVVSASNARAVYLNGANKVTDTTALGALVGIDTTAIGALYNGAGARTQFFDGDLAEVAIWNIALSDAEIALLATGALPGTMQPTSLIFYAPIGGVYSPEPDQSSGNHALTVTGATTSTAFPPLVWPSGFSGLVRFPSPILPLPRQRSFTQSMDLAAFFPPPPPPIASYGWAWPKPVFPKSAHATLGGFIKRTDPWAVPDYSSALLFINVNGIPRAYGRDTANGSIDDGSLTITDTLNQTPNTCQFVARGFTPTAGMRVIIALAGIDNPSRLFAGTIKTVTPKYVGTPGNPTFTCACIDDTWLLNKRKVLKTYTSQSASAIAQDLLQTYAPGFTWRHVDPSLDTIDVITFTNEDLTTCLNRLAKRIGVDWKIDYFDDLWFGTEGDGVSPVDLTEVHASLDGFTSTTDLTDLVTRCFVEGGGVTATSMVAVGDTILPLQATDAWYNAAGGTVVVGTQRLTYAGVQLGGAGSLVGPGIGPASAPMLALAAGAGVETGAHSYAVTFVTAAGESLPSPVATKTTGAIPVPSAAPVAGSPTSGGAVDAGNHSYSVTFVNATGETTPSPVSAVVAVSGVDPRAPLTALTATDGQIGSGLTVGATYLYKVTFTISGVETGGSPASGPLVPTAPAGGGVLTNIPTGPVGTTDRTIYRTLANGSSYFRVSALGDNTTTTMNDAHADGVLGAAIPAGTLYQTVPLTAIPLGDATVTARKIYRASDGPGTKKLLATIADNVTTTYNDALAEAAIPGTVAPTVNTATANRVSLSALLIGAGTVTQRKVYRTVAGGAQLKLLTTIADNVTTTYVDSTADASLGANVPTSDTSGLTQPNGQVLAGQITLLSAVVGWAASTGGWAVIGNGQQVIRYTGISGNTLTGIPASGIGAITATISYNSTITAAPCLTGIPASGAGSILYAINKGDPVNLLVQVDDTAAQAILSALLDPNNLLGGAAGIREDYIQDNRISETEARARGLAQLALLSRAQTSVTYTCRDPLTASGRTITIDLPSPTSVSTALLIQQVMISNFSHNATLFPTYSVQASNVRFSFEDLLRQTRHLLNG